MDDLGHLPARHKLTVGDFERMDEAGLFGPEARIELIDGELIDMAPIGEEHAAVVGDLAQALFAACLGRATVWSQNPVLLDGMSLPQPDISVLRRPSRTYRTRRPGPSDILLVVEVADSSIRFDRTVKLPRYAQAGIPEFWLVDLNRRAVDAYRGPSGSAYREMTIHGPGDRLRLVAAPEIVVTLGPIFG